MVCKEDVVSWFKELESYKRIDAMCTLLNMCLPFELRFIGTYLEELGKRDFQELRGAELRANSPSELAADIADVGDPRTRRKMALYVSLLRSCNSVCAASLYRAMLGMERARLLRRLPPDLLEEVLLLYTMALHHPAFTFHQKSHFGEVLDELKREEECVTVPAPSPAHTQPPAPPPVVPLPPNMSVPPPSLPPPGLMFMKPPGLQGEPRGEMTTSPPAPVPPPVVALMGGEGGHYPPPPPEYLAPPWMVPPLAQPMETVMGHFPPPGSPGTGAGGGGGDSAPPSPPPLSQLAANFEALTTADTRLREAFHKLNGVRRSPSDSGSSGASPPPAPAAPPPVPPGPPVPRPYLPAPHYSRPFPFPCRSVNGDAWAGFVPVVFAPPKLSCWNCGAAGHAGHDCPDPSMEEVTRAGCYQLDFAPPPAPPATAEPPAAPPDRAPDH